MFIQFSRKSIGVAEIIYDGCIIPVCSLRFTPDGPCCFELIVYHGHSMLVS